MEVDAVNDSIYADWGKEGKLDPMQEDILMTNIDARTDQMVLPIIHRLRELAKYNKKLSVSKAAEALESLKCGLLVDANNQLCDAIDAEWKAASIFAQTSRLSFQYFQNHSVQIQGGVAPWAFQGLH